MPRKGQAVIDHVSDWLDENCPTPRSRETSPPHRLFTYRQRIAELHSGQKCALHQFVAVISNEGEGGTQLIDLTINFNQDSCCQSDF